MLAGWARPSSTRKGIAMPKPFDQLGITTVSKDSDVDLDSDLEINAICHRFEHELRRVDLRRSMTTASRMRRLLCRCWPS